eukprot:COSAG06_NODE_12406_length_1385_cov_57.235614_2_plen_183_part_00
MRDCSPHAQGTRLDKHQLAATCTEGSRLCQRNRLQKRLSFATFSSACVPSLSWHMIVAGPDAVVLRKRHKQERNFRTGYVAHNGDGRGIPRAPKRWIILCVSSRFRFKVRLRPRFRCSSDLDADSNSNPDADQTAAQPSRTLSGQPHTTRASAPGPAENASLFSTFPTLVPSLSWHSDRFLV